MVELFRKYRVLIIALFQVVIILLAFYLSFMVRFDLSIPERFASAYGSLLLPLLAIKVTVFWRFNLFRGWWRYVSMSDLLTILQANIVATIVFTLYAVFAYRLVNIPRSILLLDGIFCFLMMGGVRFMTRAYRENYFPMIKRSRSDNAQVVIVGAGQAGQMIVREIRYNPGLKMDIIGFIDDDPHKNKQQFQGVPVLGKVADIEKVCSTYPVDEIIIAIPSATGAQMREIVTRCQGAEVNFKTLPGVGDLIDGKATLQKVKKVDLEDLLGRETVKLDVAQIETYIKGKSVLVTGAGGSIGCELCRQVAHFGASTLVLFEIAETPLFHIERELTAKFPGTRIIPILGDVRDADRIETIFGEYRPEVVFHAAAYKHVPMIETNPAEAVSNNVQGTMTVADAAHKFDVGHFVMISTDKAVNPANVMGSTKRVAELYIQNLARTSETHFVTVRFGNVLGSNGSVVPIFREQIDKGGPVTVTHPEVTRYFMTIPEASQLVVQAGCMGKGGEIFILEMGDPVRIIDLAENMIALSGFKPHKEIEIAFTGLRPGEKLYEELLTSGEGVVPTEHEKILVARADLQDQEKLHTGLTSLCAAARIRDFEQIYANLHTLVPEYQPANNGNTQQDTV